VQGEARQRGRGIGRAYGDGYADVAGAGSGLPVGREPAECGDEIRGDSDDADYEAGEEAEVGEGFDGCAPGSGGSLEV
jgi:hypothetical protein